MNRQNVHFLVIILLLCACKCPDKERTEVFTPPDFDPYTKFMAGSWWVYENHDDPEVIDSIYIYNHRTTFKETDDKECITFEWYFEESVNTRSNNQVDSVRFELIYPPPPKLEIILIIS